MTPFEIVSVLIQLLVILFGAAAIGYFIGRHCKSCRACLDTHDHTQRHVHSHPHVHSESKKAKALLPSAFMAVPVSEPATSTPVIDDLKIIEGIGPAIEKLLHAEGIKTFEQLAHTHIERLDAILKTGGPIFAAHNPASWPEQASLARDGKWEELEKRKSILIVGLSV